MKHLRLLLLLIWITGNLFAQDIGIKGSIQDGVSGEPVANASVVWALPDSTFVQGETTDEQGRFWLKPIQEKEGILSVSYLGYEKLYVNLKGVGKPIDLGDLQLIPSSVLLTGVEVSASNVLHKVDRQIYLPSDDQVKKSVNGLDITQRLGLPRILIDARNATISLFGEEKLKLLINGADASSQEVATLLPREIERVEYYDNPGLRYGENVGAVINYITKKQEKGGNLSFQGAETLTRGLGFDMLSGSFNKKNSQWKLNYAINHNNMYSGHIREQSFNFPEGTPVQRMENGENHWSQNFHAAHLIYNYVHENVFFSAKASTSFTDTPYNDYVSELAYSDTRYKALSSQTYERSKTFRPSLDLYFARTFSKSNMLALNLVGTYSKNKKENRYEEFSERQDSILSAYFSNVDGRRYSLIAELCYEKKYTSSTLTIGTNYTFGHTENQYTGTSRYDTRMLDQELYGFIQYSGSFRKLSYMGSLGISYIDFNQRGEDRYADWKFCPKISLQYAFSPVLSLRYSYTLQNQNPSLSYLSDVEQQVDNFRITKGNPRLRSYFYHRNLLDFNLNASPIRTGLTLGSYLYTDPIMEETAWNEEKNFFIKTYANQQAFHRMKVEWTLGGSLFNNHVSINSYVGYSRSVSKGQGYTHDFNDFYYIVQLLANYKQWGLTFVFADDQSPFWGETVSAHNFFDSYELSYRFPWGRIGISSYNLFGEKCISRTYVYNDLTPHAAVTDMKSNYPSLNISLSFNLDWGKKMKEKKKTIQNSDKESGILNVL